MQLPQYSDADLNYIASYARGVGPEYHDATPAQVERLHQHGLLVHPYTANTQLAMKNLINANVDGAFSNYIDRYIQLRDQSQNKTAYRQKRAGTRNNNVPALLYFILIFRQPS